MNNEFKIHTKHFKERLTINKLSLFDIFKKLYPEKAKAYITPTDQNNAVRKIRNWQDGYAMPKTLNEMLALCELLNCDVDYIIGKQKYARKDNLNAMQKTGLEEVTIEEISRLSISEKHIIDAMFSRTNISFSFIGLIKKMLFYSHPQVKNNSHITLDKELTSKDDDYSNLEKSINTSEILEILSYRLGIEMNEIIKTLSNDKELSDEILLDYENKYFSPHRKVLSAEELPKFNADGTIEIVWEIGFIENKILDRLTEREEIGNHFDYHIKWLHNVSDFSTMMKEKRLSMSKDDYRVWLSEIERKTR